MQLDESSSQNKIINKIHSKGVGTGFAVGGIITMLVTTASQAVYPTFSTRNDAISTLGGTGVPTALFWNTAIVISGLLWLYGTYRLFHKNGKPLSSIPFYLAGVGFILVGLSPWNEYPLTHTIGAQLVFFFGAISCLVAWRIVRGTMGRISFASGLISLFAYFLEPHGLAAIFGTGGVERLLYYPILLWEIAFGGYLLSLSDKL